MTIVASTSSSTDVPPDLKDFASLWKDPGLGDGITTGSYHTIPVGKPRDFFARILIRHIGDKRRSTNISQKA
jgi:hypothetical protein